MKIIEDRLPPVEVARLIFKEKYSDANVMFLAGSVMRGQGTNYSDLDLVVVYENLEAACRDSFYYMDWPVEVFVHDAQTLKYFIEKEDIPSGCPSLPDMIVSGKMIPQETGLGIELQKNAQKLLKNGPKELDEKSINSFRYAITDLVDDIREPLSPQELTASATKLYGLLAEFYLRVNNQWSAKGKSIIRKLRQFDKDYSQEFEVAFSNLFKKDDPKAVIDLCEKTLSSFGGFLFEGYKLHAPKEWRL